MSKQEKSRKPLIVGIIAAVVILAVLLVLLLTQCTGGQDSTNSTPVQTTSSEEEIPTYSLYWNLDRAEYDGKSEAGMSSRQPESDGYFHVRFFLDGEIVELKVADRKTINAIDVNDLMDLEFDEDGIVVGIIPLDDVPCEQVGWKFYVQSAARTVVKLNSSSSFNGMEVLLDIEDNTGIYDMTGMEGEVGMTISPISGDRVIAIADLSGKLTHVFVIERPTYMKSFKAECQHCMETVEWKMWDKTNSLPLEAGHFQLQNDITLTTQMSMKEDAVICLDLNGYAVDGADGKRMYSLHNVGCELAIMDTSEAQTGVLRGHGEYTGQGGIVWTRYGAFYLYSGTLDASDLTVTNTGAAVCVPAGTFFYMYGGTITGGTAKYKYDAETGKYSNGNSGNVYVTGKFVMYDGVIKNGYAWGAITARNDDGTAKSFYGGRGGNLVVAAGGEFEMRGGTIQNGKATVGGGNISVDSTGNVLLEGGVITGGRVLEYGRNGGNVYLNGSKATMTMNGGYIINGVAQNCAGNLYTQGTVTMNGGYIGGGTCMDWNTGKVDATDPTTNVYNVNGKFVMYGGTIAGGFSNIDTAVNTTQTTVVLGGLAKITGEGKYQFPDLTLNVGGDNVKVTVAKLANGAKIGVNTSMGIFTTPTNEANLDNFYSNMEGADVCYYNSCLAIGRTGCVCGLDANGKHIGDCDGTVLFWAPIKGTSVPTATGNYYLVADMKLKSQVAMVENAIIHLDLNGYTLNGPDNHRTFSLHNPGTYLTVTDSSAAKTGAIKSHGESSNQGSCIWTRYGAAVLYQGTLDASDYKLYQSWSAAGKDGIWGTSDDTTSARQGAAVDLGGGTTFTMYGGTIIGGTTVRKVQTKTVTEGEGEEATSYEATFTTAAGCGGAVSVASAKSVFNMYGGTIKNGVSQANGGNMYITSSGTVNLYGGTIEGGFAGLYGEDGSTVVVKGTAGNIYLNGASATLNILGDDVLITGGTSIGNGGNMQIASGTVNMEAGTVSKGESLNDQGGNMFLSGAASLTGGLITDGTAKNGGNIAINSSKDVTMQGVTISNGVVSGNGGNIRSMSTNTKGTITIGEGTLITGGQAKNGGNISLEVYNGNKNNPAVTCNITGGTIEKGEATAFGGNIYLAGGAAADTGSVTVTVSGGLITEGKTTKVGGAGGNIRLGSIYTTLNVTGNAVISNGQAGSKDDSTITGWAGNIDVYKGTLNMSGGTVSGGWVRNNGGSIRVAGVDAVANITAGTIYGGENLDQGGNLWVGGSGVLNIDGTVTDGKYSVEIYNGTCASDKNGGNIHANANTNITLNGVKIYGGQAGTNADKNSANVNITNPSVVNIGTVDIAGRFNIGGTESTVTMYGKPVIQSGSSTVVSLQLNGNVMDISGLDAGEDTGKVGIWGTGKFAAPATTAQLAYFYSDSGIGTFYDEAALWIGTGPAKYCLCGLTSTDPDATHAHEDTSAVNGCDGTILKWEAWSSTTTLPTTTGNYYLTDTVTISSPVTYGTADQIVNIDLNGQTVTNGADTRLIRFWNTQSGTNAKYGTGVHLTFTDTSASKTGNITTDACYDQGGIAWVCAANAKVTIIAGTYDASGMTVKMKTSDPTTPNSWHGANAINVSAAGASFEMFGGTLIGGRTPYGGDAVAVTVATGTAAIHGGEIKTHENSTTNISIRSFGAVTIDGAAVVEGTVEMNAKNSSGTLTLAGSPEIEAIYLSHTTNEIGTPVAEPVLPVITITGELGTTTPILVSTMTGAPGAFTGTTVEENADKFVSSNAHMQVQWNAEDETLDLVAGETCLCGSTNGTHSLGCTEVGGGQAYAWTPIASLAEACSSGTNLAPGKYYLTADITTGSTYTFVEGETWIDLNGHTITRTGNSRLFRNLNQGANSSLTITDIAGGGKLVNSGTYTQGGIVWVKHGGRFNFLGGTMDLSGYINTYGNGGSAVATEDAGSSFYMYGGEIIGGTSVGVQDTTKVDGNGDPDWAKGRGGSVYVASGTYMYMKGGTIRDGKASYQGGNIFCVGTLEISGGTISGGQALPTIGKDNTSLKNPDATHIKNALGGNIYCSGQMTITGGSILNGTSYGNGGNINYAQGNAEKALTMQGGVISGGESKSDRGGNIWIAGSGKLNMTGGFITNGTSYKEGGNIWGNAKATIELSGGSVTGGLAQNKADSIYGNVGLETGASTLIIGNVTIDGYVAVKGSANTVSIYGNPQFVNRVDQNNNVVVNKTNLHIAGNKLVVGEMSVNAKVGITANAVGVFSTAAVAEEYLSIFTSDSYDYKVVRNDAGYLELIEVGTLHTEHDETWNKITNDTTALTEGRWYLDGETTASITSTSGTVIICLNGQTWSGELPLAVTEGVVRICDCTTEGTGLIAKATVASGAALSLEGGTITTLDAAEGASVTVKSGSATNAAVASGATLTVEDGYVTTIEAAEGASVTVEGGSVTAATVASGASLTVEGGTITTLNAAEGSAVTVKGGNIVSANVASATLSGSPMIASLRVDSLTVGTLNTTASVGISADEAGVLVSGTVPYSYKSIFSCSTHQVAVTENGLELLANDVHAHCVCAGTMTDGQKLADNTVHNCLDIVYTAVSAEALTGGSNRTVTANWYLESDVTITGGNYQLKDSSINLCLNGHNWNGMDSKRAFSFQDGTNYMSITTCQADVLDVDNNPTNNRVVATGTYDQGGVFWVRYGTLDLYAGHLDGSAYTARSHGGTVCIGSGSTMNMYGGTILGAYATANSSNTKMNGGSMSIAANGVLNLYNGTITGGRSNNHGGNILLGGTLNMYDGYIGGGKISGKEEHASANIASNNAAARINISGGEINGGVNALVAGLVITVSDDAKLTPLASDGYYRVMIQQASAGVSKINLVIGQLSDEAKIYVSNVMTSNVSYEGVFATAAEGYTLTQADADRINVWYNGGAANKTVNDVVLRDGALYFAWVD